LANGSDTNQRIWLVVARSVCGKKRRPGGNLAPLEADLLERSDR